MSPSLLNIILWIPFGIVLLIVTAIFLTSGYKRGLWRALLSLGATVVSTVLSLLLARWIAPMVSAAAVSALPPLGGDDLPISEDLILDLIRGAIGVVLALILFSVFLFIISIIIKTICNYAAGDKLKVQSKGLKWAGLGVRLVDAVVFSLLLVLPLYGTLAAYGPTAQVLVQFQAEENDETVEYFETVVSHPVVQASRSGPVSWVYGELSSVEVGGIKLDIASMASSAEGLINRVEALSKASEEELIPLAQETIGYVRENVLGQDWCYNLAMQLLEQVTRNLQEPIPEEDRELMDQLLYICDVSKEQFRENADELLAFAQYMLENRLIEQNVEDLADNETFLKALGDLINSTEQAVALKNLLIMAAVKEELYFGNAEQANRFANQYLSSTPIQESMRAQEAKSFLLIVTASDLIEMAQALETHPAIGAEQAGSFLDGFMIVPIEP